MIIKTIKRLTSHSIIFLMILSLMFISISHKTFATEGLQENKKLKVKVFFPNPTLPEFETTCGAVESVTRKIPRTRRVADAALKQLFAGPTKKEKAKGMEAVKRFAKYYKGISIKKETAIVNFQAEAEDKFLSLTACEQEYFLTPIAKTLLQFKTIKSVEYAIEGKIIEEWDA